jgi:tetratricopeptide (TPR) repeat protein
MWRTVASVVFCCFSVAGYAQPKRQLAVRVMNASVRPERAVPRVTVALVRMSVGTRVTLGMGVSDTNGRVVFDLPASFQSALDIRLEVTEASGLVLYKPEDGALDPTSLIHTRELIVKLVSRGSPALLEPSQLEALIVRLSKPMQVSSQPGLESEVRKLDLTNSLRQWAGNSGFTLAQVEEELRNWSDAIRSRTAHASTRQKALAEFAARNFSRAAELFGTAAQEDRSDLDRKEQRLKDLAKETNNALRRFLDDKISQAGALQANLRYSAARGVLEEACGRVDKGLNRQWWLQISLRVADARTKEGELGDPQLSVRNLQQAINEYERLLRELSVPSERTDLASAQHAMGTALVTLGQRTRSGEAPQLLGDAVKQLRSALQVRTKADLPRDWAATQYELGVALQEQGKHNVGRPAIELLKEAVQAFRSSLEVRTQTSLPQEWAESQTGLAGALANIGVRSSGAESVMALQQAMGAYQSALDVFAKTDPLRWAGTQHNLGIALQSEGERSRGAEAMALLKRSAQAFRAALGVFTRVDLPQSWARTQHNLGNTLEDQAERTSGPESTALLAQAVQAYRAALEVRTKKELPQDWAKTQSDLGLALEIQGENTEGAESIALLEQAVQAKQSALEVFTRSDLPYDWARTQHNLGVGLEIEAEVLELQGERTNVRATALREQAIEAFTAALEVRTEADLPQDWAVTQMELGTALKVQGEHNREGRAAELLGQSVQAYQSALRVRTKSSFPQLWARTQVNLGSTLLAQAMRSSSGNAVPLTQQAEDAYRSALEVFTRGYLSQDWAEAEQGLGDALRVHAEQSTGGEIGALLPQAIAAYQAALEIFTKAFRPQIWGEIQRDLGRTLSMKGDWEGAAGAMENALNVLPDDVVALAQAEFAYQEHLFQFAKAFELNRHRLRLNDSQDARLDFVEKNLTTARFADCVALTEKLNDREIEGGSLVARDVLRLACAFGSGQKVTARRTAQAILQEAASLGQPVGAFSGTKHFLGLDPAFAAGRESWIQLFEQLEKGDGNSLARVVRRLDEVLKD